MKQSKLTWILLIEALLCLALQLSSASAASMIPSVLAFPFAQLGWSLRALSLSGDAGNAAAIVLYALLCLLPAAAWFILRLQRRMYKENELLLLLSGVLFAVLYFMINPGTVAILAVGVYGQAVLGGMVYSVLCGYLVLRVLRLFSASSTDKLLGYLSVMLFLLCMVFVYILCGVILNGWTSFMDALKAGQELAPAANVMILTAQFLAEALVYILDIIVTFAALSLIYEMRKQRYSAEALTAAERLSRLCITSLAATVLSSVGVTLLQLLLIQSLTAASAAVQFPLFSILFILAALLLARFIAENKQLKDDNDLIV